MKSLSTHTINIQATVQEAAGIHCCLMTSRSATVLAVMANARSAKRVNLSCFSFISASSPLTGSRYEHNTGEGVGSY